VSRPGPLPYSFRFTCTEGSFVFCTREDGPPHLFWALPCLQNRLVPDKHTCPSVHEVLPATLIQQRPSSSPHEFDHDYSEDDPMLTRLALATWADGPALHCVKTIEIRRLIQTVSVSVPERISKWATVRHFNPLDISKWSRVWGFHCDSKEACLLWKLFYQINATQTWRLRNTPITDPEVQCILYITRCAETEQHLFWDCHFAQKLWIWLSHVVYLQTGSLWVPQLQHALLGNKVPRHLQEIQAWWELLRGSLIWYIWLYRNAQRFSTNRVAQTQTSLACQVWLKLHVYIRIDFHRLKRQLKTANIRQAESLHVKFRYTWGLPPLGPLIDGPRLILPPVPALPVLF
jgi:hypothetical protein